MNLSTEITFVSKHYAVMIFLAYLLEEKKVMDACLRYVIRMYDATYFTDSMEFISILVQTLRSVISPVRRSFRIVTSHGATLRPCVLADLMGLESMQNTSSEPSMATATSLRISSVSRAACLRRALNCRWLIRFGKSSLHS